jgi:hypothetical protein
MQTGLTSGNMGGLREADLRSGRFTLQTTSSMKSECVNCDKTLNVKKSKRVAYRGKCPFSGRGERSRPSANCCRPTDRCRLCTNPAVADASERGFRRYPPASCKRQDAQSVCGDERISYHAVLFTRLCRKRSSAPVLYYQTAATMNAR